MMSRSRLFLGGLRSRRARLRFNGRLHLAPTGRIRKPGLRKVAHFSTGIMPHFQPELTNVRFPRGVIPVAFAEPYGERGAEE